VDFDKTLIEIAHFTEYNEHTRAYILGSKLLGSDKLVEEFNHIQDLQDIKGYLDAITVDYRYKLYNEMMDVARYLMTKDEFNTFYQCF